MKTQRVLIALTVVNLALLAFQLFSHVQPARASGPEQVLRGKSLEIVDDQGRVRASLNVMPAGVSAHGDSYPETVLLRLITEQGRPSVKISTSEQAAMVALIGPTNTKDTYVQLGAAGTVSSLRLKNEDGGEKIFKP